MTDFKKNLNSSIFKMVKKATKYFRGNSVKWKLLLRILKKLYMLTAYAKNFQSNSGHYLINFQYQI